MDVMWPNWPSSFTNAHNPTFLNDFNWSIPVCNTDMFCLQWALNPEEYFWNVQQIWWSFISATKSLIFFFLSSSSGQSWRGKFMNEVCSFHRRMPWGEKIKTIAGTVTFSQINRLTVSVDKRVFDIISKHGSYVERWSTSPEI